MKAFALVFAPFLLSGPAIQAQNQVQSQAQNQAQNQAQSGTPLETAPSTAGSSRTAEIQQLRADLARLSARLDALEKQPAAISEAPLAPAAIGNGAPPLSVPSQPGQPAPAIVATAPSTSTAAPTQPAPPPTALAAAESVLPKELPGGATLNYTFDGYYEFNFNRPPGRVNDLRAYDVLSNAISINQAALILALDPDVEHKRRYGFRLDLQYGQATSTLQGSPANEARPDIYRNIYQAYGTYVVPVGKGLQLDFGKWASSLGYEGNYSKDQSNYTRAFFFNFLPFYHQGVRASYTVNDKLKVNYWLVNGTNQAEPTNGYKDELFGFVLAPTKKITWTSNYYLGQEHPDSTQATNCTIPEQPGLCVSPIIPAANGKLHIFNNYASWQVTPKLNLTGEGDYLIQREWKQAGPGESAAPSHVSGGSLWALYQVNPRLALSTRGEYMSDRNGLFSNASQALKEVTGTYKYTLADGLDVFLEYRHDWTNIPYFRTHDPAVLADHQTTATMGLVWWYGGKAGAW